VRSASELPSGRLRLRYFDTAIGKRPFIVIAIIFVVTCRLVVPGINNLETAAWALSIALRVFLIALLVVKRNHVRFPFFFLYIAATFIHGIEIFVVYRYVGFHSTFAQHAAWSAQGFVILFRALAIVELCREVFAQYAGIRGFILRVLAILVSLVMLLAMVSSDSVELKILYANRAASLALSFMTVAILLFARYYFVRVNAQTRSLALGFFLYSCFSALNDTVLETLLQRFAALWNFLDTVSFIGCVLIWCWAARRTVPHPVAEPEMISTDDHHDLSSEMNRRLAVINDRLSNFSKGRARRP
jgi:hypothetical protein